MTKRELPCPQCGQDLNLPADINERVEGLVVAAEAYRIHACTKLVSGDVCIICDKFDAAIEGVKG